MDADPSGKGQENVTPRNGKAVEINALWYANLLWVQKAKRKLNKRSEGVALSLPKHHTHSDALRKLAGQVKQSFNTRFWNDAENCLFDVIDGDVHSGAVRPNQVVAISHGEDLLTKKRKKQVFDVVTRDLLTPAGLRTLSPRDSSYRGTYDTHAPMAEKDYAYHQGTVWPWLMGPYGDAFMKLNEDRMGLKRILTPLVRFAIESEFKSLPEVFSGDPPHEPGGTTSQAWSVGEVLRLIVEHGIISK
jgi:predicted glycogen debranching enzyme